jgi:hypothetical protein
MAARDRQAIAWAYSTTLASRFRIEMLRSLANRVSSSTFVSGGSRTCLPAGGIERDLRTLVKSFFRSRRSSENRKPNGHHDLPGAVVRAASASTNVRRSPYTLLVSRSDTSTGFRAISGECPHSRFNRVEPSVVPADAEGEMRLFGSCQHALVDHWPKRLGIAVGRIELAYFADQAENTARPRCAPGSGAFSYCRHRTPRRGTHRTRSVACR